VRQTIASLTRFQGITSRAEVGWEVARPTGFDPKYDQRKQGVGSLIAEETSGRRRN
jgi:hypothetical protein